jgi:hypothetical protein
VRKFATCGYIDENGKKTEGIITWGDVLGFIWKAWMTITLIGISADVKKISDFIFIL